MKSLYAPRKTRIIDTKTNQVIESLETRRYARKRRQIVAKEFGAEITRFKLESNPQVEA